jgi:DNA-directed RNA polymerase subunit RPC12/RpoP
VLGLRFYVCDDCKAVYADVEEPPGCRCDATSFRELTSRLQDDTYFLPRGQ